MNKESKIEKYFSVIILAAGRSERIGFPKLSLKYNNQTSFLEQIVQSYHSYGVNEVIIVVNKEGMQFIKSNNMSFPSKVQFEVNDHPDWHRFYSLKLGVRRLINISSVFVHNVDNPFVSHKVLSKLTEQIDNADYISPEYKGRGGHPILITKEVVVDIQKALSDKLHLKSFLNQFKKARIQVNDKKVLVNINTLEDYRKYFN